MGYEEPFPIAFVLVKPRAPKFSEELSHRDFLGALMNLGIERGKTGDIIVKDNKCLIICEESLCDFIISELSRVRHTEVSLVPKEGDRISIRGFIKCLRQVPSARRGSFPARGRRGCATYYS